MVDICLFMQTNLTRSSSESVGRNEKPVRMKARQDANAMVFILQGVVGCSPRVKALRHPNISVSPLSNNQKGIKKPRLQSGPLLFASRVSGLSVAIVFRFVWTFLGHSYVLRLFVVQFFQVHADLLEVKPGNLFIQVFR